MQKEEDLDIKPTLSLPLLGGVAMVDRLTGVVGGVTGF